MKEINKTAVKKTAKKKTVVKKTVTKKTAAKEIKEENTKGVIDMNKQVETVKTTPIDTNIEKGNKMNVKKMTIIAIAIILTIGGAVAGYVNYSQHVNYIQKDNAEVQAFVNRYIEETDVTKTVTETTTENEVEVETTTEVPVYVTETVDGKEVVTEEIQKQVLYTDALTTSEQKKVDEINGNRKAAFDKLDKKTLYMLVTVDVVQLKNDIETRTDFTTELNAHMKFLKELQEPVGMTENEKEEFRTAKNNYSEQLSILNDRTETIIEEDGTELDVIVKGKIIEPLAKNLTTEEEDVNYFTTEEMVTMMDSIELKDARTILGEKNEEIYQATTQRRDDANAKAAEEGGVAQLQEDGSYITYIEPVVETPSYSQSYGSDYYSSPTSGNSGGGSTSGGSTSGGSTSGGGSSYTPAPKPQGSCWLEKYEYTYTTPAGGNSWGWYEVVVCD